MSLNTWILKYYTWNGGLWFRLFGYGLRFSDRLKYAPLFSERYNYGGPYWYIGKWSIKFLKPGESVAAGIRRAQDHESLL